MKKFYSLSQFLLFFLCLTFLINGKIFAQEKTTLELLQGKKWIMQHLNDNSYCEAVFTRDTSIFTMKFKNPEGTFENKDPYYLSNEVVKVFDEKKVGKVPEGKYIIINRLVKSPKKGPYKEISIYEILKLSDTVLIFRNMENYYSSEFKSQDSGA